VKDRADLDRALELQVDWIALSFVQRPEDIAEARQIVAGRAGVLAKLEKPAAIDQLDAIIAQADALMVARGDLGVELPLEYVPGLQKQIVRAARRAGKPVVVATQMLESMITNAMPTRAEVSDVATAVFEGADAVMLSAESAVGHYPVEAVTMMNKVAMAVETDMNYRGIIRAQAAEPEATAADAISAATRQVAETLDLAAIVTYTSSGSSSLRASRERPAAPILSMAAGVETARRLTLAWGIHSVQVPAISTLDEMSDYACETALREGFASKGDTIVVAAGTPVGVSGTTNMLKILNV
jgi:pyruvate kinase